MNSAMIGNHNVQSQQPQIVSNDNNQSLSYYLQPPSQEFRSPLPDSAMKTVDQRNQVLDNKELLD